MKSIIIIIDHLGKWPEWFPIFLESCRRNPTITWLFHTDCPFDSFNIENVIFRHIEREDYLKNVSDKLGIRFAPPDNYKLCDLRPMYGVLYEEEIRNYDFFGYGDTDVIYGNIRKFYTDEVLEYNIVSSHNWGISGHLCLIKNKKWLRNAFRRFKGWEDILEHPISQRFDEDLFINVFKYPNIWPKLFNEWPRSYIFLYDLLFPLSKKYRRNLYFKEQFTTPLTPGGWRYGPFNHPIVWFWKDGNITNEMDGNLEFIYLHFMNYKNARFMDPIYGEKAFWHGLPRIVHIKPEEIDKGIRIDRYGFHAIDDMSILIGREIWKDFYQSS